MTPSQDLALWSGVFLLFLHWRDFALARFCTGESHMRRRTEKKLMIQILQLPLRDAPVSAMHDLHECNYMLTVETAYTGREAWWYLLRTVFVESTDWGVGNRLQTPAKVPTRSGHFNVQYDVHVQFTFRILMQPALGHGPW